MEIQYTVVRSPKRRKLTITVERDRAVVIRAPKEATDEAIAEAVNKKRQWLIEKLTHPQKYQERHHPPGKEIVNGESALYLGKEYRIDLIETESGQVEFADAFLIPRALRANRQQVLRDWYINAAESTILPLALRRAKELGVTVTSARIVDTRFRWGSCTPRSRITFNWRLVKAPMFVVDYVVIHELAHLLEANHSSRFWSIVRAHTATAEKAKVWLKEHGQVLEEEI